MNIVAMEKRELLCSGSERQIFATDDDELIIVRYCDIATAFDDAKRAVISGKGMYNNRISTLIFKELHKYGVDNWYVRTLNDEEQLCRRVEKIPLRMIVRNIMAGSMAERMDVNEGMQPSNVIYELRCETSSGVQVINDYYATGLGMVTRDELKSIYGLAAMLNQALIEIFKRAGIILVDFKIEFGRTVSGDIILADEITPDTCRLWAAEDNRSLDKDRFCLDMGEVAEAYREVYERLSETANE